MNAIDANSAWKQKNDRIVSLLVKKTHRHLPMSYNWILFLDANVAIVASTIDGSAHSTRFRDAVSIENWKTTIRSRFAHFISFNCCSRCFGLFSFYFVYLMIIVRFRCRRPVRTVDQLQRWAITDDEWNEKGKKMRNHIRNANKMVLHFNIRFRISNRSENIKLADEKRIKAVNLTYGNRMI